MDQSLDAGLRATMNMIPAHTWYAAPAGALTSSTSAVRTTLVWRARYPLRFGTDTGAAWDSHLQLLHPDDHEEARRVWSECLRTAALAR